MNIDLDGPVHYVDFGGPADAPGVVYVHGLGGSHLNWTALAPLLSEHVRAVAVDLPGFGRTPAAGRRTTVRANAGLLRRFLQRLGGGPSILVGNSMGGYVSMLVAVDQPTLVSGVVLVDPTLPMVGRIQIDPAIRRQFFLNGIPGVGEWSLARRYATVPARQRVSEVLERCCSDAARVPKEMVEAMISLEEELTLRRGHAAEHLAAARSIVRGLARPWSYWRRLQAIRHPVLLLHGTHDRLVPIASAHAAAKRLPHWTFTELDAGHIPQMETPEPVAAEIIKWLSATHR
ncbi:MAG TPA: alpha/beta hydrolase [Micromonosporaceae bacterium]|nr:alpha/beta hydrolase [Micromonosporaceae bacterium]